MPAWFIDVPSEIEMVVKRDRHLPPPAATPRPGLVGLGREGHRARRVLAGRGHDADEGLLEVALIEARRPQEGTLGRPREPVGSRRGTVLVQGHWGAPAAERRASLPRSPQSPRRGGPDERSFAAGTTLSTAAIRPPPTGVGRARPTADRAPRPHQLNIELINSPAAAAGASWPSRPCTPRSACRCSRAGTGTFRDPACRSRCS